MYHLLGKSFENLIKITKYMRVCDKRLGNMFPNPRKNVNCCLYVNPNVPEGWDWSKINYVWCTFIGNCFLERDEQRNHATEKNTIVLKAFSSFSVQTTKQRFLKFFLKKNWVKEILFRDNPIDEENLKPTLSLAKGNLWRCKIFVSGFHEFALEINKVERRRSLHKFVWMF